MIIVIGSAGILGNCIVQSLIASYQGKIILTANNSLADITLFEKQYPGKVVVQKCDVSKRVDIDNLFKTADSLGENISGLINNFAYTFSNKGDHNVSARTHEVQKVFDVNYFGIATVLEATVNWVSANEASGVRVVNILSNSLKTLNASNGHYIASKAAIETITRYYAKHYARYLSLNCVAPGLMRSKLTMDRFEDSEQRIIDVTPLGRLASPQEISELVTYLATSCPLSVCGQTIFIDGGRTL